LHLTQSSTARRLRGDSTVAAVVLAVLVAVCRGWRQ
jgi:hypothetical protein